MAKEKSHMHGLKYLTYLDHIRDCGRVTILGGLRFDSYTFLLVCYSLFYSQSYSYNHFLSSFFQVTFESVMFLLLLVANPI